jgi:hypothetical protein
MSSKSVVDEREIGMDHRGDGQVLCHHGSRERLCFSFHRIHEIIVASVFRVEPFSRPPCGGRLRGCFAVFCFTSGIDIPRSPLELFCGDGENLHAIGLPPVRSIYTADGRQSAGKRHCQHNCTRKRKCAHLRCEIAAGGCHKAALEVTAVLISEYTPGVALSRRPARLGRGH